MTAPALSRPWRLKYATLYLAAIAFIGFRVADHHHPDFGFAWLPLFGELHSAHELPRLAEADRYIYPNSHGYDGQYYAQLALYPTAIHPDLAESGGYYHYRTRRILLSWTAWLAGAGHPPAVINAYAFQNAVFWLAFAGLLLRWLPPTSKQNLFRYLACLFTLGLVESWNRALLDGPSLCLIAVGALAIERNRKWLGAAILGLAGLAKETNLLAASGLRLPHLDDRAAVFRYLGQLALCAAPLALWLTYLYGNALPDHSQQSLGSRNFSLPLVGWTRAFADACAAFALPSNPLALLWSKPLLLLAILAQFAALALVRRAEHVWWRIGASFAILGLCLGDAVWEGETTAAAIRVLLPATIAVNLVLPRQRKWLPLLVVANLPSLAGFVALAPQPPTDASHFYRASETRVGIAFVSGWHAEERSPAHYWRWSSGPAAIELTNPTQAPIQLRLSFSARAVPAQSIAVSLNDKPVSNLALEENDWQRAHLSLELPSGAHTLTFRPEAPPVEIDSRPLSLCLMDWRLRVQNSSGSPAASAPPPAPEPIPAAFASGWHPTERQGDSTWAWAAQAGPTLSLDNPADQPVKARFRARIRSLDARPVAILLPDGAAAELQLIADQWQTIDLPTELPPGASRIELRSDPPGVTPPGDARSLRFCLENPTCLPEP